MEVRSEILFVKDWEDNKSVQIMIDEKKTYTSFYWDTKDKGPKNPDLCERIKKLSKGDTATFDLFKTEKGKYYINDVMPEEDIHKDTNPMEGMDELDPERQGTKLADDARQHAVDNAYAKKEEPNSFNSCNAMNASANLMNVIIEVYGAELKPDELFKMHQDILSGGVMKGARVLLENYY